MAQNSASPFVLSAPPNPSPEPFREACNRGDVKTVQQYITDSKIDEFSLSMGLKHAIAADQVELIHFFVALNVKVPLGAWRCIQSPEVWELFFAHGVEINPRDARKVSPLLQVVIRNDPRLLRWILTRDKNPDLKRALESAAAIGNIEVVDILIEHGAPIKDSMAMHYALFCEDQDSRIGMMEYLLQHGMGVNNFGNHPGTQAGGTPLFTAANMSALNLVAEVQWLLDHGADPRIRDRLGRLAIQYALHSGELRRLLRDQRRVLDSLEAGELGLTGLTGS